VYDHAQKSDFQCLVFCPEIEGRGGGDTVKIQTGLSNFIALQLCTAVLYLSHKKYYPQNFLLKPLHGSESLNE
jgi:hypothetical protein